MLEYRSKTLEYDSAQNPVRLRVLLGNSEGAVIPVNLPPDRVNLTNSELFEQAMELFYQENFPNRAENEKFSDIDRQMAKMVENEAVRSKEFEEMKEQFKSLKTESELTQQTMQELILQIMAGGTDHEEFIDNTNIGDADEAFNE
ncbi:TPA: DUF1366 domain-containing protein [Streptococcus suis]|nr:DUF1366 domain-containing protein [Streptococcus suis]